MLVAAALLAVVSYGVWKVLDEALGRSLLGQIVSVGGGLTLGAVAYGLAVHLLRIPEARQIERLLAGRLLGRDKR
jgi:putative peptidoglycan lipid II flippase